ncbi:uncharacterized protein BDZ99DRAFT_169849 [Mytilinidion resinicola]|uniref:Uncharacterized protein n=1 Tax=Mytilinidion resinicola TaxID=574789 RepID=A0A6A6Y4V9_9PEZI|nr:uncharacterized protein BDZ99DRAFT_169849 [Mytilinidion resinicola]KAF2803265.1 hypothetical protein BDZ99DRAFT_169849 [Mytilinidion resinicola]
MERLNGARAASSNSGSSHAKFLFPAWSFTRCRAGSVSPMAGGPAAVQVGQALDLLGQVDGRHVKEVGPAGFMCRLGSGVVCQRMHAYEVGEKRPNCSQPFLVGEARGGRMGSVLHDCRDAFMQAAHPRTASKLNPCATEAAVKGDGLSVVPCSVPESRWC